MTFIPHRICLLGDPLLIGVSAVSDIIIALAYVVIPLSLLYLMYKTKQTRPNWMSWHLFGWFAAFIFFCGMTHVMDVIVLWYPYYWASAGVKVMTGFASVLTAFLLGKAVPKIPKQITEIVEESRKQRMQVEAIAAKLNVTI